MIAPGDRRQRPEIVKGERQGMNCQARYCFEMGSRHERQEHSTSSQSVRFLPSSQRARKLFLHCPPSRLAPRVPPSKPAGPSWPTGRLIQRTSGARFPRQPPPAWSSHPLL